jgi:hypothetical protein
MRHIKDGRPALITCWYDPKATYEPYTVVFSRASTWNKTHIHGRNIYIGRQLYVSYTPQGAYCHGELEGRGNYGRRVDFWTLPKAIRDHAIAEYADCWRVEWQREWDISRNDYALVGCVDRKQGGDQ